MSRIQCPVCKADLGTPEEARALGAFVLDHGVDAHYFDSLACKSAFEKNPKRFHASGSPKSG